MFSYTEHVGYVASAASLGEAVAKSLTFKVQLTYFDAWRNRKAKEVTSFMLMI